MKKTLGQMPVISLSKGFTLIELMVVITILGLIAAFAAPQIFKQLSKAQSDAARIQIENLSSGLDLYKLEIGRYPDSLQALISKPSGVDNWNGPYLKKKVIPKDPWGKEFIYRYPGKQSSFDLLSYGADGVAGGEGENKDIVSWE